MDRHPFQQLEVRGSSAPIAFGRRLLVWLGVAALVGLILIIRSGTPPRADGVPAVTKPQLVLFAIRGTATSAVGPGVTAFLAVITPNAREVMIYPVPGTTRMPSGLTLSEAAQSAPARTIAQDIAATERVKLSGYLVINVDSAEQVLTALWDNAPSWPQTLNPITALGDLGWPDSHSTPHQLQVLNGIISNVPDLTTVQQESLVPDILFGLRSDLSFYQMFTLVTYVRGERLVMQPLHRLPPALREKKVTH